MDFEKQHNRNLARYERQIKKIYEDAVAQVALIGAGLPNFNPNKPFYFADYPVVRQRIEKLVESIYSDIYGVIINGIDAEWTLANNKNSELAKLVFGENLGKIPKALERKYFSNNLDALDQFKIRKINGLGLSDRVWKLTGQYKEELEMGIDIGLRNGQSAVEMSRDLRKYLDQPDKLFRRVRDQHGNLHLSKRAKAYNPGQGTYRSSYKNARRLTATETNMAYRNADYERRMQADYIVGIEVRLSNNHTINGVPFTDICDELKGKYPKEFVFTGWHPLCRCHTVSILKSWEEMEADNELMMQGKEPLSYSENSVKDLPSQYTRWLQENSERVKKAKNLPYFIKDNIKFAQVRAVTPANLHLDKISTNILKSQSKQAVKVFSTIEPFSPNIIRELSKFNNNKQKQRYLAEIMNLESFQKLDLGLKHGGVTKVHKLHKKGKNWDDVKEMAKDINKTGVDVSFLPEYNEISSADAITKINKKLIIVDFKYSTTFTESTLKKDLQKGFEQAHGVVLKYVNTNRTVIENTIDEMIRKGWKLGDLKIINKYGECIDFSKRDLKTGKYKKKIRGFL